MMEILNWLAQTVAGQRPACSANRYISANGRWNNENHYRLLISYTDENGDDGRIVVRPDEWREALMNTTKEV